MPEQPCKEAHSGGRQLLPFCTALEGVTSSSVLATLSECPCCRYASHCAVDQFNAFDVLDQADEDGNMDAWEEVAPKKTAAARKAASASQGKSAAGIKNRAGTASQPATDALTGVNSKQGSAGDKAPVDDYYRCNCCCVEGRHTKL